MASTLTGRAKDYIFVRFLNAVRIARVHVICSNGALNSSGISHYSCPKSNDGNVAKCLSLCSFVTRSVYLLPAWVEWPSGYPI